MKSKRIAVFFKSGKNIFPAMMLNSWDDWLLGWLKQKKREAEIGLPNANA